MPDSSGPKKRVGIVGCGAMGSTVAHLLEERFSSRLTVSAVDDLDSARAEALAKSLASKPQVMNFDKLVAQSDLIIESASMRAAASVARHALHHGKDVLIMSVGGLVSVEGRALLREKTKGRLFIPSGAVAGLDALTAVRREQIDSAVLKTSKPPRALKGAPYFEARGVDVERITQAERIFSGTVEEAVEAFPQNINVAASIFLALGGLEKFRVEVYADPACKRNTHEIFVTGSFGVLTFKTENEPAPGNAKTSYLAILSVVAAVERMLDPVRVGT